MGKGMNTGRAYREGKYKATANTVELHVPVLNTLRLEQNDGYSADGTLKMVLF